ncbi:hypothetical protein E4H04_06335 [Candidatus Bathyarchaeota archaeon]|nr:MAG: hypothetical protein E4H04_06335 [Candidatus Bathyarchaeota archaeon]
MPSHKKYITRTFRLPEDFDEVLRVEAEKVGQSVNSVAESVIAKYVYNDRFYSDTQLLSMAPMTISSLLLMLSDDEVVRAGKLAGGTGARDNLLMRGMSLDFASVKWFIEEIMARYAGWFTCNYHLMDGMHMFHLRHVLDKSWSLFVQAYVVEMVSNVLKLDVDATVSDNTVTLRIPVNPGK